MSRNDRLFWKLLGIILGLLLIGYILSVSIRMNMVKQPEGKYIKRQDALILTEALEEPVTGKEDSGDIEPINTADADKEVLLTYGQFLQLTDMLSKKEQADAVIKEKGYKEKYKEEHFFLAKDWYEFYEELLAVYHMQEQIELVNVTPLGIGDEVSKDGSAYLQEKELLTEEGIYNWRSEDFLTDKYQVLKVYKKDETLLTVKDVVSRGMKLKNIWVMEAEEGDWLQIYYDDYEIKVPFAKAEREQREQIGDLDFADGALRAVEIKNEKISGKLLSIRDGMVEIEGKGKYPYDEEMRVYKLYGSLCEGTEKDIRIGYDFTDFVIKDGRIRAGLMTRDEAMETIRVVIKNTDFAGAYHEKVELTADTDFTIRYGSYDNMESREFQAGDVVTIDKESAYFTGDRIYIEPAALTGKIKLLSVKRAQGNPSYRGKLEIAGTEEGLVVVNELLLEEYLYSVVPSEMPASYPLEALKAQAICARTYAYRHMSHSGIAGFGAHVDDSAGYQVYNNISEDARTTKAVKETSGSLLYYGDTLCGAYYYSTSCGFGTDTGIWKSESAEDTSYLEGKRIGPEEGKTEAAAMAEEKNFADFINGIQPSDYESKEAWYRWTYQVKAIDVDHVLDAIKKRYEANSRLVLTEKNGSFESLPVEKLGDIKKIEIIKRNSGGVADELLIEGTKNTFKIISEHNIRYVLNDGTSQVVRQDGSEIPSPNLLPSAYILISPSKKNDIVIGYSIVGGGYGHGVGMSQNGAKEMAKKGFTAEDIVTFFYRACEVKDVY